MDSPRWWTPQLPVSLLALYAINALADSFPLTASSQWLNTKIEMQQATQSIFYAVTFLPYSFKPVYGAVSDYLGSRRAVYVCAALLEALLYVACGTLVTSTPGAFGAVITRDMFAACSEMMLSAALADAVTNGPSARRAQSEATGARWVGTIAGYGVSLLMYRCGNKAPPPRRIIASTSLILGAAALIALFGWRDRPTQEHRDRSSDVAAAAVPLVVVAQLAAGWVALKDVLVKDHRDLWRNGLYTLVACVAAVALFVMYRLVRRAVGAHWRFARVALVPALLVFGLNAAPSAIVQLSNLEFYLFFTDKPCYVSYVQLITGAASLAGCSVGALVISRYLRCTLATLTLVSAAASLLFIPLARKDPDSTSACLLGACVEPFAYDAVTRVVTSFCSELALLAETTLVLKCALALSPEPKAGASAVAYGTLLAVVDTGASVSGWITAPLVRRAKITYGDFSGLPWLLKVCALAAALALAPLPFVQYDEDESRRQLLPATAIAPVGYESAPSSSTDDDDVAQAYNPLAAATTMLDPLLVQPQDEAPQQEETSDEDDYDPPSATTSLKPLPLQAQEEEEEEEGA